MIETIPFLGKPAVKLFSNLCRQLVVLRLPIYLSCLQWPFRWGSSERKGIAAFSGFVGYTVMV